MSILRKSGFKNLAKLIRSLTGLHAIKLRNIPVMDSCRYARPPASDCLRPASSCVFRRCVCTWRRVALTAGR